ncbi:MAG: hypothetical protein WCT77_10810 [Bacteroidota bacterium]
MKAIKTYKPSFSSGRGRTWSQNTIKIDGKQTIVDIDSTYGNFLYFNANNVWFKLRTKNTPELPEYQIIFPESNLYSSKKEAIYNLKLTQNERK